MKGEENTMRTYIVAMALMLVALGASGQEQAPPPPNDQEAVEQIFATEVAAKPAEARFHDRYPRYRIQSGDTLAVSFSLSPEFNQEVAVQPDGYVSLRDAGDLHIAGLTSSEASAAIAKAYAGILREPMVSVVLKDFEKPFFIAGGELKQPGRYDLRGSISVVQAIAMAGGFTEASKHSEVYLFRRITEDKVDVKKLNVKKMISSANLSEDMFLKPGDVLWVPQNLMSKLKGFIIPRGVLGPMNPFPRY